MNIGEMYILGWGLIDWNVLIMLFAGTLSGVIVGIIPGLGPTLGIAVLLPFTFDMNVTSALALLLGMMCGGTYGGSIAAILCNIPGTPVAMMTCQDGYPMAQQGKAGKAIGVATIASLLGGIFSAIVLSAAAPTIAKWALKFAAPEYFSIAILGISIIAYISPGNMTKGLISGILGLILGIIGSDPLTAVNRFTFGSFSLLSGVSYFSVLIGLYGAAEVMRAAERHGTEGNIKVIQQIDRILPTWKEFKKLIPTTLKGSIIGTFIGAIPAAGGSIATIVAYGLEKRFSKDPDSFGKGNPRGIAAPESANNGCTGGALIPLLTLGIPGDPGTAALMGCFLIQGLTLGPTLFTQRPADMSSIFIILILANILFTVIGLTCARPLSKIITLPMTILMPIIGLLCCVGVFAVNNNSFDFIILLICCALGYLLPKANIPAAPMVLGLVLGPIIESNFRRTLIILKGNFFTIFSRPIACVFIALTIFLLILPSITGFIGKFSSKVRNFEKAKENLDE